MECSPHPHNLSFTLHFVGMATSGAFAPETTLILIVKQLQYFSQEISTLKQQRAANVQHTEALAEQRQLQIDAQEAQILSHISKNESD